VGLLSEIFFFLFPLFLGRWVFGIVSSPNKLFGAFFFFFLANDVTEVFFVPFPPRKNRFLTPESVPSSKKRLWFWSVRKWISSAGSLLRSRFLPAPRIFLSARLRLFCWTRTQTFPLLRNIRRFLFLTYRFLTALLRVFSETGSPPPDVDKFNHFFFLVSPFLD